MKKITKKWTLFLIATFVTVFGIGYTLVNRGTYSADDDNLSSDADSLIVECPENVIDGSSISCSISLNSITMSVEGISAKYSIADGLEFVKFVPNEEIWDEYTNDENGFVLVSKNDVGVSGSTLVGNVEYKISDESELKSVYRVELVEATIGNGDSIAVTFEDVYAEIKIKNLSDDNTLESISLGNISLNENFDKTVNNYTANVDSGVDTIEIEYEKTNEKSVVTINEGYEKLYYGTNNISIKVVSESGQENVYNISVFRKYSLVSDKYAYNEDKNYIYTGIETNEDIILSNISIPEELSKNINNNKLIISYDKEELLKIDILNMSYDGWTILEDIIYINNISYGDFIEKLGSSSNKITYKVFKNNDEEVTSGDILTGMKLEISDEENILDNFMIDVKDEDVYDATFDNELNIDKENKFIKYLDSETNVSQLLEKVEVSSGYVKITNSNNNEKNTTDVLSTGDVVVVYDNNDNVKEKYVLSLIGDCDGNGVVNLVDLVQMRFHIAEFIDSQTNISYVKTGPYFYALDFDKNNVINLVDLVRMRYFIAGVDIDENT